MSLLYRFFWACKDLNIKPGRAGKASPTRKSQEDFYDVVIRRYSIAAFILGLTPNGNARALRVD